MSLRGGFGSEAARVFALCAVLVGVVACGDDGGGGPSDPKKDMGGFGGNTGGSGGSGGDGGQVGGGTPGGGDGGGGAGGVPVAGTGGDGGGGAGGETPCTCERNLTCDASGQCVERSPCEADLDCSAGRICEGGACADGCVDDAACAGNGLADQCVEGRCVQCTGDADCFGRATCDLATNLCAEANPCDDSRECLAPNICNVRTHTCTPPFDCRAAGATCNEGLECDAMSGRCVTPTDCTTNANCPVGQRCSAGRPRTCGPCAADDECEGTQVCQAGECREVDCVEDADCLGNRVCQGGECLPPACEDDAGEDNDTAETAELLGGGGAFDAMSCGGDDDFYRFTLPRNTAATISVLANGLGAELDLEVVDGTGEAVGAGSTSGLSEVVVAGPFLVDRDLVVRVFQRGPAGTAGYLFDLGLQVIEGDRCPDDAVDAPQQPGDDAVDSAQQLRGAGAAAIDTTVRGRLCPGDADWFCLTLADGEDLHVVGSVTSGDATIDAELVQASNGMSLGAVQWARGQAAMELSRSARGTYCVHLTAAARVGYDVRFTTTSRAIAAFCDGAEALALDAGGAAHVSGRLPEEDLLTPSCGSANLDGGEVAYAVTVDQPKLLVARITGEAGGTLGDPMISVRADCASPNGELACNDDRFEPDAPYLIEANPAEIRVPLEVAGTVTVIVDGTNPGERPDYRLDVEVLPLATPPANDRCVGATDLELQDGLGRIRVSLDRAADDFGAACLPASGPDAVYNLRLAERSRVSAQVFADFAAGVYLTSACGQGEPLGCGTGFDLNDVPAGNYFLVIEGVGAQARGRVQGQVIVEPVGAAPANDTCATAERLDAGGGERDATTLGANADLQLADGNQCTGDNTNAGDVLYLLPVVGGASYFVEAIPEGGWDLSLYAMSDCRSPGPTCLAGHDGALTERIEFTAGAGDEEVFIAVDGANGEAGRFHLTWGALP